MAIDPVIIDMLSPVLGLGVATASLGWVATTWLKVRHGYPLESSWGKPLLPMQSSEQVERIRLITQENAQLKAELGSIKDRLQVLERIATDGPTRLAAEIDRLAPKSVN
ncbi:hypothetical protein IP88_06795 [alpha proteobacterium AAP81b]|nr:hypothetical protein IP88_06795 [alpha proteobacterium AAP81b]